MTQEEVEPPASQSEPDPSVSQATTAEISTPSAPEDTQEESTQRTDEATISQSTPNANENTESPRIESHEDSDFEDNITVTVPPPHLQSGQPYRDRHLNGRHGGRHHHHHGGMDTPPKNPHLQV